MNGLDVCKNVSFTMVSRCHSQILSLIVGVPETTSVNLNINKYIYRIRLPGLSNVVVIVDAAVVGIVVVKVLMVVEVVVLVVVGVKLVVVVVLVMVLVVLAELVIVLVMKLVIVEEPETL